MFRKRPGSFIFSAISIFMFACAAEENHPEGEPEIPEFDQFRACFNFLNADTIYLNERCMSSIQSSLILTYPDSIYENRTDWLDSSIARSDYELEWLQKNGSLYNEIPDHLNPLFPNTSYNLPLAEIDLPGDLSGFLVTMFGSESCLLIYKSGMFLDSYELSKADIELKDTLLIIETHEVVLQKDASNFKAWSIGFTYQYDTWLDKLTLTKDTSWFKTLAGDQLVDQPTSQFPDTLIHGVNKRKKTVQDQLEPYRKLYQTTKPFDLLKDTLHVYRGMHDWDPGNPPFDRMYFDYDYLSYTMNSEHPGFHQDERYIIETEFYGLYRMKLWKPGMHPMYKYTGMVILTENYRPDLVIINGAQAQNRLPLAWSQMGNSGWRTTESWIYCDLYSGEMVLVQKWLEQGENGNRESGIYKFVLDDYGNFEEETVTYDEFAELFNMHAQ